MRTAALLLACLVIGHTVPQASAQTVAQDTSATLNLPQAFTEPLDAGPSLTNRVASGLGGALLGAGLGFFASQLVQGDWQDGDGGEPINRSLWAMVGGGAGFSLAFRFPLSKGQGMVGRGGFPMGRDHLGRDEFAGIGFDNVYEAISTLRPEWLRVRGNRSLAASVDPVVVDGAGTATTSSGSTPLIDESATIQVYVDDVSMGGGIEGLRTINILNVQDIYFFDPARATNRWGGHNPQGGILVVR